jgi:hypothetical protein
MPASRARRSSSTASWSAACRAPMAPSGNTPRSASPPRSAGPSCTPPNATRAHATHASACTASRPSSSPPAGRLQQVTADTARNSASRGWAPPSNAAATTNASSAPGNFNGCVERVQLTVLEERWRPAFARSMIPRAPRSPTTSQNIPRRMQDGLDAVGARAVRDVGALEVEVGHPLCGRGSRGGGPGFVNRSDNQPTVGEAVVLVEQLQHLPPERMRLASPSVQKNEDSSSARLCFSRAVNEIASSVG